MTSELDKAAAEWQRTRRSQDSVPVQHLPDTSAIDRELTFLRKIPPHKHHSSILAHGTVRTTCPEGQVCLLHKRRD